MISFGDVDCVFVESKIKGGYIMEPIVSPWLIYFFNMIEHFRAVLVIFAMILVCIGIGTYFNTMVELDGECEGNYEDHLKIQEQKRNTLVKILRKYAILVIGCFCMSILIPNKNTIIAMYVANFVTTNNIEKSIDTTKDIKNILKKDIIDIIQSIQETRRDKKE